MTRSTKRTAFPAIIGTFAALLAVLASAMATAHAAATVVTQGPCTTPPNDYCLSFGASGTIPDIRNRSLHAPGPGTAIVTFHGSLTCANLSGNKGDVQFVSQIVDTANAKPNAGHSGGLIHVSVMPPHGQATFNLASTRVFKISAAGNSNYIFRIARVMVDPTATECRVYNAAFTIQFEPGAP